MERSSTTGNRDQELQRGVTVVIPVWDQYDKYLDEAIESVEAQRSGARVLVVDNASNPAISVPENVQVARATERLSVGAARNLGVDRASTEYVLVLDADDRLLPGTLPLLSDEMDADESLSICATLIQDGHTGKRHRNPRRLVPYLTRWRAGFAFLQCVWSFVPIQGCAMFRTTQVRDCGGYPDDDWGDDWVLATSLSFRGRVEIKQHIGRFYRATPESLRAARGTRDDLASARLVRRRIVDDPGVTKVAIAVLPLIWLLQMSIVFLARPLLRIGRRLTARD